MIETKRAIPHDLKLTEEGAITLAFSQLDVIDRDSDITVSGAIPTKDVPMSAYGHTSWDGALPIGRGTVRESAGWGVFDGQFLMDTDQGRNAYGTVKAMAELQEYSYGYDPLEVSFGQVDGRSVRYLNALDIFEVSPVLVGAGIGTHTMAIKSGEPGPGLPYADHLEGLLEEWRAFIDRSRDRAEFRAKEGRALSAASRERLVALMKALREAGADLDTFLVETEPPKPRMDREIAALRELARLNGVALAD
jgi:hypothetical protein